MRCQVCGVTITDTSARECPQCGSALTNVATPATGQALPDDHVTAASAAPSGMPSAIADAAPPSNDTAPPHPQAGPTPPPGWVASPYAPYGPYGYAGPPPGPGMSPGYPFPPPVSYPPLPTVTARRTSTWLIVSGAVAAVLVFCTLAAGGVYVLRARVLAAQATPTGEPSNLQPVATDAATPASINLSPGWVIVYHNSLKSASDI